MNQLQTLNALEATRWTIIRKTLSGSREQFWDYLLAMKEAHDSKLYRDDYPNFDAFTRDVCQMSAKHVYYLLKLDKKLLSANVTNVSNDIEVVQLSKDNSYEVLTEASRNGPVTAAKITEAANTVGNRKPEHPIIELDHTGFPVPEEGIALWQRSEEVSELMSQVQRLKRQLTALEKENDLLFAPIHFSQVQGELHRIWADIKQAIPYAVCTTCQGKLPKRCGVCHGRGFLSEIQWTAVPEELKTIRAKAVKR